jgi:hypothetical protein
MSRNLVISSTCFPHKAIHKGTWRSPYGKTYNQTDHVLIDRRNDSSIIDVRTCRGANGDSDHYLVKVVYRCRIMAWKDGHISKEPKINIQKLGNPEVHKAYQKLLGKKLTQQEPKDDIDKDWENLKQGVLEVATTVLGYAERPEKNEWFDEECNMALVARNQAYQAWLSRPTQAKRAVYEEKRRQWDKLCRKKKRTAANKRLCKISEEFEDNDLHKVLKKLN